MGRVKDFFWDEIEALRDEDGDGPDLLEMLAVDAISASERLQAEIDRRRAAREQE